MKIFLRRITSFIGFALVFYLFFNILWGLFLPLLAKNINYRIGSYGYMHTRIQNLKAYSGIDILFLGSSHAYRGFDPRIFKANGIRVFNLGSSSQTPIQTEVLLDRYLESLKPKLVVYEVSPVNFSSDGVESAVDIIANDTNDIGSIKMALKINHVKVYNTLIYGLFRGLLHLDSSFVEDLTKGDDTYVEGGFVEKKIAHYDKSMDFPSRKMNLKQKQLRAFEKILSKLREREVAVFLVQAPVTSGFYHARSNNSDIDAYFRRIGNYYNFNKIIELSDNQHFYDERHLNQAGVELFNAKLLEILRDNVVPTKKSNLK